MIDKVLITIKSGNGGNGSISGRKEKFVSAGGPDGGDGGRGGHIIFKSSHNLTTLKHIKNGGKFFASNGEKGKPRLKHGSDGNNLLIEVPVGTTVYNSNTKEIILDFSVDSKEIILQKGGSGGKGNTWFKSSTNRFPLLAEKGENIPSLLLDLEMRILADVGIIGLPNAGKSTTLSRITKAKPKIAGYPFTTLEPAIGIMNTEEDERRIKIIEVPGLIEGAHKGAGLGIEFLKHAHKTHFLIHLVDGTSTDIQNDIVLIEKELSMSHSSLENKPKIIVVNKLDQIKESKNKIKRILKEYNPLFISALSGEGIATLMLVIQKFLNKIKIERPESINNIENINKRESAVTIFMKDEHFVIDYYKGIRVSGMVDLKDPNAKAQWDAFLEKAGVFKKLIEEGIKDGDLVRIGNVIWVWGD